MKYLSFKEFVDMYGLKDQATSSIKTEEVLDKLTIPVGIYMRDDQFTTTAGIVNFHPTKGTHWVMFANEFYFDSYGCLTNILNHIKKVSIKKIKFRKIIVIVQRFVYMFYISHKL